MLVRLPTHLLTASLAAPPLSGSCTGHKNKLVHDNGYRFHAISGAWLGYTWVDWASSSVALTIQRGTCGTALFVAFRTIPLYQNANFPFRFPIQVIWLSPELSPSSGSLRERYSFALIVALLFQQAHLILYEGCSIGRRIHQRAFAGRLMEFEPQG